MNNQEKKMIFNHLYNEESSIFVHVNTLCEGVTLPNKCFNKKQITLRFGQHIIHPTTDTRCSVQHIQGTLLFGDKPFKCVIPLAAVVGIVGGDSGLHHKWDAVKNKVAPIFNVIEGGRVRTERKSGHLRLVA